IVVGYLVDAVGGPRSPPAAYAPSGPGGNGILVEGGSGSTSDSDSAGQPPRQPGSDGGRVGANAGDGNGAIASGSTIDSASISGSGGGGGRGALGASPLCSWAVV
ncbi:hypothetical protein Vafri_2726, partial [Volvox africanus]